VVDIRTKVRSNPCSIFEQVFDGMSVQVEEDVVAVLETLTNHTVAPPTGQVRRDRELSVRPPNRRHAASAPRHLASVACGHRSAPIPMAYVILLGLAVCLAVVGLGILANAGAGTPNVPTSTAVVRVEPGENLSQLAERVAPHSDPAAVVDRIRELNSLAGSDLRPGQPLTVPVEE
jgi:hypothetical protein